MTIAAIVLGAIAVVAVLLRSLKIAQLEHYLPGSVTRTVLRWYAVIPANVVGIVVAVALGVGSFFIDRDLVNGALLSGASLLTVLLPWNLSIRKLEIGVKFTRRMNVVTGLAILFVALFIVVLGSLPGLSWAYALWLGALLTPLLVDAALAGTGPIEDVIGEKYANAAGAALRRVGPQVVAITGSFGKTTTKEYLATMLSGVKSCVPSPASFNNKAGLSRAVSERLEPGTEVFVAEMGTYGPGEIKALCRYFPPDVSVFTAIGPVHLERMKTIDTIVRAKSEIFQPGKPAVINIDYPELAVLADEWTTSPVIRVGTMVERQPRPDAVPDVLVIATASGFDVEVRWQKYHAAHEDPASLDVGNIACAIGAVVALEIDPALVMTNIAKIARPKNRRVSGLTPGGFVVIDDTFNSNPVGARAATAELARQSPIGTSVVVTPGMVELGSRQAAENEAWIAGAANQVDRLIVVGRTNRRALLRGAAAAGIEATTVSRREQAVTELRGQLSTGDGVLYENDLPIHYP